jgi:hypothetical protein
MTDIKNVVHKNKLMKYFKNTSFYINTYKL